MTTMKVRGKDGEVREYTVPKGGRGSAKYQIAPKLLLKVVKSSPRKLLPVTPAIIAGHPGDSCTRSESVPDTEIRKDLSVHRKSSASPLPSARLRSTLDHEEPDEKPEEAYREKPDEHKHEPSSHPPALDREKDPAALGPALRATYAQIIGQPYPTLTQGPAEDDCRSLEYLCLLPFSVSELQAKYRTYLQTHPDAQRFPSIYDFDGVLHCPLDDAQQAATAAAM
jgi:hypothetical protein